MNNVPIFPLNTVLYPDGILPLRIFEPRYTDMVSECLREDKAFGVCLIEEGMEVGEPAGIHEIGTMARIIDWDQHEDGLLGITGQGGQRFRVIESRIRSNQLMEADIELLDHEDDAGLPAEYQLFSDMLRKIVERFDISHMKEDEKYDDAYWVGCRLAELLPVELGERQAILEMDDPIYRLIQLQSVLDEMDID